jgi:hypothetical protein
MNNNKNFIIQEISNLKRDIQNLINDKKGSDNKFIIKKYDEDKQIKMDQLKRYTEQLKAIYKREREEKQIKTELELVGRQLDNLDFRNAKKNSDKTKAKIAKEIRQNAHEKYLEYLELEKMYYQIDPQALPGILFLNQKIIREYGICPYIKHENNLNENKLNENNVNENNVNENNLTDLIYNKRLEWLSSQNDNGVLYYNLYDTLINRKELTLVKDAKLESETKINKFIEDILTDNQYTLWEKCVNFMEKYVEYNIKTKRLKESFKIFTHDLSILYSEVNINFHKYLTLKYDYHIDVNNLTSKNESNSKNVVLSDQFDEYITEYQDIIENIKTKSKFITNTIKNLKQDLCIFLTNNSNSNKNLNTSDKNESSYVQVGKYFKRWILLSQEERLERFESYSLYYVHVFLLGKDIIDISQRDDTVNTLSELLKSAYVSKKMIYRDIKWNTTKGIIELVKILQYDKELGFVLKYTKQIMEKREGDNNLTKKKLSFRTIITKESEKIINEDLLYFIVDRLRNGVETSTKEDKEAFAEKIKLKLKIKRLTINDKIKIFEKYDEIFHIVKNNQT